MNWKHRVKVKHLFTEEEDHEAVQGAMTAIADVLDKALFFSGFNAAPFRKIPKGDDVIRPVDYANKLIDRMYDYAHAHAIWIE